MIGGATKDPHQLSSSDLFDIRHIGYMRISREAFALANCHFKADGVDT